MSCPPYSRADDGDLDGGLVHPDAVLLKPRELASERRGAPAAPAAGARRGAGGVSFRAPAGAAVALMDLSGSGKSTLLHILGAMETADAARVRVGETEVTGLRRPLQSTYRRSIGFVFQRFHSLPALTIPDNVLAPVIPYRVDFDKARRARELLDAVGLADRAGNPPGALSGGEQQRVAIARALINQPGLLLADEPTGNLDSATGGRILGLLLELQRTQGMTIVVATHDALVASRCERILAVRDGRIEHDFDLDASMDPQTLLDRIAPPPSPGVIRGTPPPPRRFEVAAVREPARPLTAPRPPGRSAAARSCCADTQARRSVGGVDRRGLEVEHASVRGQQGRFA